MKKDTYVIGVDYGSDSVRAILVNTANGEELASSVFYYPRWKAGKYCNPATNQFRQHPLDYLEGLEFTIKDCLHQVGQEIAQNVRGISVDTTGSTPVAVDATGTPLALTPGFEENPNAMFILWKDHTAIKEAAEINKHATKFDKNYLQYVGGIYSSEWFWAKLLHVFRTDEKVRAAIANWVEHCDWIPFLLAGGNDSAQIKRGVCSAGHKGLWSEYFDGFPPNEFFASLDPVLDGMVDKLPKETFTADKAAGKLCSEWAEKLGLTADVVIGIGAIDAHVGAVGGQIEPYYLSKVMGTSTCDMLVIPNDEFGDKLVRGICGQVNGSIIPGMVGLEAGQSAFGDVFAWFKNLISWPLTLLDQSAHCNTELAEIVKKEVESRIIPELSKAAAQLPLSEDDEIATDWLNGRRTPDANQEVKGAVVGLNLGTDAPAIFKALVEATCFGAKAIVDRYISEGLPVKGLIGLGGVARKSSYIMQVMADVMNMPIRIHKSEQTCAAGAAMLAATVCGIYPSVEEAMQAMGQGFDKEYIPNPSRTEYYAERMKRYQQLGHFTEINAI
ncbi:MAG: ribulokinase [Niabella sp.]